MGLGRQQACWRMMANATQRWKVMSPATGERHGGPDEDPHVALDGAIGRFLDGDYEATLRRALCGGDGFKAAVWLILNRDVPGFIARNIDAVAALMIEGGVEAKPISQVATPILFAM